MKQFFTSLLLLCGTFTVLQAQNWPYVGAQGQGVNTTDDSYRVDMEVLSNQDIYTALQVQSISGGSQRVEVYHYNGSSWQTLPVASSGEAFAGSVFIRKGTGTDVFVAYGRVNMSNFTSQILVKKYNGSAWVAVGDPLSLTTGSSFGFALDQAGVPMVIGARTTAAAFCISKWENNAWVNYPAPVGPPHDHNTFYVDAQGRVVYSWMQSAVIGGQLVIHAQIDTFHNGVYAAHPENLTVNLGMLLNLLPTATGHVLNGYQGAGVGLMRFKSFTLDGGSYTNSSDDTLSWGNAFDFHLLNNGKLVASCSGSSNSLFTRENGVIQQVFTPTAPYFVKRIRSTADKVFVLHAQGVQMQAISNLGGVGSSVLPNAAAKMLLYPNPATQEVRLRLMETEQWQDARYSIINSLGQTVAEGPMTEQEQRIALPVQAGLYRVLVKLPGKSINQPLVIH